MGSMAVRAILTRTVIAELDIGRERNTLGKSKRIIVVEALLEPFPKIHMELLKVSLADSRDFWKFIHFREINGSVIIRR